MIKFNNYQSNDQVEDPIEDQNNVLKNEAVGANQSEPQTRSSETFLLVCALAAIWILPFIRAAEAGGLGGLVMTWVGIISTVFGALVFYFLYACWLGKVWMKKRKQFRES